MAPPPSAPADWWDALIHNAGAFMSTWATRAHRLGWTSTGLFAVHPTRPVAALDVIGLVPLLGDRTILAMTADTATLDAGGGVRQTYRRSRHSTGRPQIMVWDLSPPGAEDGARD